MTEIPTTLEMDGLLTPDDIERRHSAYIQCRPCAKWTKCDVRDEAKKCAYCGSSDLDTTSVTSERSFNHFNKRRPKLKK